MIGMDNNILSTRVHLPCDRYMLLVCVCVCTGKTVQVIAFLCALHERLGVWGPHIVVMPLSVLGSWQHDMQRFAPTVRVQVHHGEREERILCLETWMRGLRGQKAPTAPVVLLTSYEMAMKDIQALRGLRRFAGLDVAWQYLVVRRGGGTCTEANTLLFVCCFCFHKVTWEKFYSYWTERM